MDQSATQYAIAFVLLAIIAVTAIYFRLKAKRAIEEAERRRASFQREARLLERRKKPRNPS